MAATSSAPPSQVRRQALRDADKSNVLLVIDTYPIDKYYAVMDRLVMEFYAAVDARQLDQAYIYGIRFATFSLESLRKHKDYKKTFRKQKAAQVEQVLAKLESVTERMDAEELQKQQREEQARRLVEEQKMRLKQDRRVKEKAKRWETEEKARQQREEAKQQQEAAKSQKAEASIQARQSNTKQSAMAKLQAMQHKSDTNMRKKKEMKQVYQEVCQPAHSEVAKPEEKKESRQDDEENRKQQEENERALQKERQRLAAQAERLIKQQREAGEEWETMNFLFKEAADGDREEDAEAAAPAITKEKERQQNEEQINAAAAVASCATAAKKEETTPPRKTLSHMTSTDQQASTVRPNDDIDIVAKNTTLFKITIQPTICNLPEPKSPYQPRGMSREEKRTIEILEETIGKQEERLADLEGHKIPALLRIAKIKLNGGDRKSALFCVARKKKLDGTVESLKSAIFTMETQMLMLESAVENRAVEKAMRAAADAMESLHGGVNVSEIHDVNRVVNETTEGVVHDMYFDEDELLNELEAYSNATSAKASSSSSADMLGESQSILSLPMAPPQDLPEVVMPDPKRVAGLLTG